jgi:hypothetical protein
MVTGAQQKLNKLFAQLQTIGPHLVENGFEPVGKGHQFIQAKRPGATLDRVNSAENGVDHLWITIATFDGGQTLIRRFKEFFALLKEGILNRP